MRCPRLIGGEEEVALVEFEGEEEQGECDEREVGAFEDGPA